MIERAVTGYEAGCALASASAEPSIARLMRAPGRQSGNGRGGERGVNNGMAVFRLGGAMHDQRLSP
jgi:hypothetical protein